MRVHEPRLLFPELLVDHLQDLVLKTEGVKEMLDELAQFSAVTLADPAFAFCSISLIQRKKPVTVASSEESAVRLDETQYSSGDWPCLSAIRQQVVVHVPDLTNDHRWPAFTAAALEAGVGSSLSVPLVLEGEAIAGLNLYSTRSHGFSGEDVSMVETYSYHASKALRLAVRISQLADVSCVLSDASQYAASSAWNRALLTPWAAVEGEDCRSCRALRYWAKSSGVPARAASLAEYEHANSYWRRPRRRCPAHLRTGSAPGRQPPQRGGGHALPEPPSAVHQAARSRRIR